MKRAIACGLVAALALALYHSTLLPGLDLGDTASFQAAVESSLISPRQGYPLYFAIGNLFARLNPDDPARPLNLASAVCASLAAGAVTWVGMELSGSLLAGIGGGLLLAVSYTFWSQAIIAEVYALHLLLIALSMSSLLAWARRPSTARLAIFFIVYAVSFGNHQSMILLAPAFAFFMLCSAPGGARTMIRPRIVLLAACAIVLGLSQYLGNFRYLWSGMDRPPSLLDALGMFWFDVTKSDWRQSMVMAVPTAMFGDRAGMYWFDLRQQFGLIGVALACVGLVRLARSRARLGLIGIGYLTCTAFAFTYNVGDSHVFYLPSHLFVALMAACGMGWIIQSQLASTTFLAAPLVVGVALLGYPAWRAVDTYPAADRSRDTRAADLLDALTVGLSSSNAVYVADFNWQVQNALDYYVEHRKQDLSTISLADSTWRFPSIQAANEAIGRQIVLSEPSAERLRAAFGSFYRLQPDPRVPAPRMIDIVRGLPARARYAFAVLGPAKEYPIDPVEIDEVVRALTGSTSSPVGNREPYRVLAGEKGSAVAIAMATNRPFRVHAALGRDRLDIRMESWLSTDTIRRAGFGHVIVNGSHAMTLERGLNLLVLDGDHSPRVIYEAGVFARQPRFVLAAGPEDKPLP